MVCQSRQTWLYGFITDEEKICSHFYAALFIKSMINENLDYSKKNFAVLECSACAARRIAVMIVRVTNSDLVANDSTKER